LLFFCICLLCFNEYNNIMLGIREQGVGSRE